MERKLEEREKQLGTSHYRDLEGIWRCNLGPKCKHFNKAIEYHYCFYQNSNNVHHPITIKDLANWAADIKQQKASLRQPSYEMQQRFMKVSDFANDPLAILTPTGQLPSGVKGRGKKLPAPTQQPPIHVIINNNSNNNHTSAKNQFSEPGRHTQQTVEQISATHQPSILQQTAAFHHLTAIQQPVAHHHTFSRYEVTPTSSYVNRNQAYGHSLPSLPSMTGSPSPPSQVSMLSPSPSQVP
jgi:hypothetical protein